MKLTTGQRNMKTYWRIQNKPLGKATILITLFIYHTSWYNLLLNIINCFIPQRWKKFCCSLYIVENFPYIGQSPTPSGYQELWTDIWRPTHSPER